MTKRKRKAGSRGNNASTSSPMPLEVIALARATLFEETYALLQETVERAYAAWMSTDETAAMGAMGLAEAMEDVSRDVAPLLQGGLARIGVQPELRHAVQELFSSVLAVGQQLKVGLRHGLPQPADVELALQAVREMLDQLERYVTRTEIAMRRVILDGVSIDAAALAVCRVG